MYVFRAGYIGGLQPLNTLLRIKHEDDRAAVLADIAAREESGAPSDDLAEPLRDPGEFEPHESLDGVLVSIRVMSVDEVRRSKEIYDVPGEMDVDERERKIRFRMLDIVRSGVGEVQGIENERGPMSLDDFTADDMQVPEVWGLIFTLMTVTLHFQYLVGEKKKAFL